MGALFFDLVDVARSLRRERSYSLVIILTLSISLGVTTAVFSIVDGVLLKPLPYADADRLVWLREVWHEVLLPGTSMEVNERHFEHWRAHSRTFETMAQYLTIPAHLTSGGDAVQINAVRASGSLFDVLRVHPALGRTLRPDDEQQGQVDVVVLGHRLWQQRFGGQTDIVGADIVLDGRAHRVVGVLPAAFRLPVRGRLAANVDAVVPLRVEVGWVGDHNDRAIGRLKPGIAIDEAKAELDVLQRQVGAIASQYSRDPITLSAVTVPLADSIVGTARRGLLLLLLAVGTVLLMTTSNLANLALSRALGRARDAAVRAALGASRARLVQRTVLEQLTLAVTGAALGLGIAAAGIQLFVWTAPVDIPRLDEVRLDVRVLWFAAIVGLITGTLVAILPARRMAAYDVQSTLRSGSAAVASERSGLRARQVLLAVQVAMSVTLLVVTGLLAMSLQRVLRVDRGFNDDRVVAIPLALPAARYGDADVRVSTYDRLLAAVEALPGVRSATVTSLLPLEGEGQVNFIVPEGANIPRSEQPSANFRFVGPGFFQTLGIGIQRGRSFAIDERRDGRVLPAVISEPVARRLWPNEDALGKRFSRGVGDNEAFEVVGIAADARYTSIERTPPLMVYVPYWWRSRTSTSLLVQTTIDPAGVMPQLTRAVHQIDPEIAVGALRPLAQLIDAATAGRRYQAQLFIVFGIVALFIATLGVYAVTAYSVSRRRREMNIRVALGADKASVLSLVLRQTSEPIIAGVAVGVVAALAIGGTLTSLLYEVQPRDPVITGLTAALVAVVAVMTSLVAVRRALRIDPIDALRVE